MSAHSVSEDGLSRHISREIRRDESRRLVRYISKHPVILRERLNGRVHIKAIAQPDSISARGVVRHPFSPRRGIGTDDNHTKLRRNPAIFALLHDICMSAGKTRQIPQHRQLRALGMWRNENGERHLRSGLAGCMPVDALNALKALRSEEHTSELQSLMRIS